MIREAINELKKYTLGRKNTEKVEVSVLNLNRIIFALEEPEPALDKIRAEFISLYPKNYAGEPECDGFRCVFSLDKVLDIIDKYRVESEVEERFDHEGNEIKPRSCANCKHLDEWVPIDKNCPCQYCNRKLLNKWEAKEVQE